jgi:CheY-like chemotaxis protein
MITHCVDAVLSQFRDRNHTITIEPRCDESLWLTVDPVRIEQVIVNVLNNAAKYTPAGGLIRITVATRGQYVDIRIIDNGIGIKRENIDDIFLPFWQSTEAMSDGASGIGVGLSLTRHIVEMHHGTIHAYSAGLEKGTAITISLPHYMRKQNTLNEDEKVDVAVTLPSHRILVVDDNVAATNSLVKLLTLTGHVVDTSYTGEEALLKIRTFGPDMNGYVVAKQLRTEGYTGILIALSGYGQNEDKEMSLKAGFNFHITKPMKLQQLESFLQGYSTNR